MRIAYGKLGRSYTLTADKSSSVGGDIEVVNLLNHLRKEHEVHLIGPNRHDARLEGCVQYWGPGSPFEDRVIVGDHNRFPDDPVYLQFMDHLRRVEAQLPEFDAWVVWLGQHGTSSSFLPRIMAERRKVPEPRLTGLTAPLMALINYVYPMVHMVNYAHGIGQKVIWLCPDPRNKLKARDLIDNEQDMVLAQYNCHRDNTFWGPNTGFRQGRVHYSYAGIELLAVDRAQLDPGKFEEAMLPEREMTLGILVNEGYANIGRHNRLIYIQEWFKDLEWEIFGDWTTESQTTLKRAITTVPLADVTKTLRRWKATMTFPATGSGWATAKPWECFAAGTICFKHPLYDDQHHIYGRHMNSDLREFLTPKNPAEFRQRLEALDDGLFRAMADRQFRYLLQSMERLDYGLIEIKRRLQDAFDRSTHGFERRISEEVVRGPQEVISLRDSHQGGSDTEARAAQ